MLINNNSDPDQVNTCYLFCCCSKHKPKIILKISGKTLLINCKGCCGFSLKYFHCQHAVQNKYKKKLNCIQLSGRVAQESIIFLHQDSKMKHRFTVTGVTITTNSK